MIFRLVVVALALLNMADYSEGKPASQEGMDACRKAHEKLLAPYQGTILFHRLGQGKYQVRYGIDLVRRKNVKGKVGPVIDCSPYMKKK